MEMLDTKDRADAQLYAWKLAYITADPDRFTPIFFPETLDQDEIMDNFQGEIEYDLSPITGEMNMDEAAEILKQFEVQ
jgi:hypothetical protein